MSKDTAIGVPLSESEDNVGDNTTVSVHIIGQDGNWREERLAPNEAMEINIPVNDSIKTIAIVDVDEEE